MTSTPPESGRIAAELIDGLDDLEATLTAGAGGEWPPTAAERLAIYASDLLRTAAGERAEAGDATRSRLYLGSSEIAAAAAGWFAE